MPIEMPQPISRPWLMRALILLGALMMTLLMFVFMARLVNNRFDDAGARVVTQPLNWQFTPPPVTPREVRPKPARMKPVPTIPKTGNTGSFVEGPKSSLLTDFVPPQLPTVPVTDDKRLYGQENRMAVPVVQIAPEYPIKAAQEGIEGFVVLSFDVRADGSVHNIEVIEAEPRRLFNNAAIKALKSWRYSPQIVDGQPVAQPNQWVRLDFHMEN
ncbi:TonB family protein [Shewanella sp. GXUN23E]|uniref:energy transducer TonB n=1 Tax=Shewanella sp. GXUN23E TaxID=3422498 RepID=UPI003D7E0ED9